MYTHHYGNSLIQYSITGGYSFLSCPNKCGKMAIKKNDFGDQIELEHDCHVKIDTSQIKSNQIKSNQIKSNQIKSNQSQVSEQNVGSSSKPKTNYLL
jgi:hypothetical protein